MKEQGIETLQHTTWKCQYHMSTLGNCTDLFVSSGYVNKSGPPAKPGLV